MSAGRSGVARLAADLLGRVALGLGCLEGEGRARALGAIDRFIAQPGPASYLAAMRALGEEARAARWEERRDGAARRAQRRGLEALAATPGMAPEVAAALAAGPADALAGARLEALAALVTVRAELEARVAGEREALAHQLAQAKSQEEAPARPRRTGARRLRRAGGRGRP